jgi:hypothetical protein
VGTSKDTTRLVFKGMDNGKAINEAMREAESSPSKASVIAQGGREFLLLLSLDDNSWSWRTLAH